MHFPSWSFVLSALSLVTVTSGFELPIADDEYSRQLCSGMWGGADTYINVTFAPSSRGQLALVIYEYTADAQYLGKVTEQGNDFLPEQRTYICTSNAVAGGFCTKEQLGRFILDLPGGRSINSTTFWSARVSLGGNTTEEAPVSSNGFWDNPEGNPDVPYDQNATPWRRRQTDETLNPSPTAIYQYTHPIQYQVRKTGYYCVAIVPVTVLPSVVSARREITPLLSRQDPSYHPSYSGTVFFKNKFHGKLPATDYPKVHFYLAMLGCYVIFSVYWGILCYRNIQDLLPIQYYITSLVGLLLIEMTGNLAYYRYLNSHGKGATSTVFLVVVSILDAGRNALSFFLLLIVSLGLSVVTESLGSVMIKCQLLAAAHFIFGVLYSVGIVELELESTSALILLLFVIPLAFTLSGFLLWIMHSLNATITNLRVRKQRYKLRMFVHLNRILQLTVAVIGVFFVVSTLSFSGRLAEDYAAKSWQVRWWLLDGWLALLYLFGFCAVAFVWRPSPNNSRLVMMDELAQDEEDAEDYDMEALEGRGPPGHNDDDGDDAATLVGSRRGGRGGNARSEIAEDDVVFEIGDGDEDVGSEDEDVKLPKRRSLERHHSQDHEMRGLIGEDEEEGTHQIKDRND